MNTKVPFANTDSNKFNRWAIIIGLAILGLIAAVVVLPPLFSGLSRGAYVLEEAKSDKKLLDEATAAAKRLQEEALKEVGFKGITSISIQPITIKEAENILKATTDPRGLSGRINTMYKAESAGETLYVFRVTGEADGGAGKFSGIICVRKDDSSGKWEPL